MAVRSDGDSVYESSEPDFEEKKQKLFEEIETQLKQDPTVLAFVGRHFGADESQILVDYPNLKTVTKLDLRDNQLGLPEMKRLFEAEGLAQLLELDLSINFVTTEAVVEIAQSADVKMKRLRALSLEDNRLKDPAGVAIAQSENFAELEWLNLSWNEIGSETAHAMGQSKTLSHLKSLNLERNYVGEEGGGLLFDGEGLKALEVLNLAGNRMGDEGVVAFAQSNIAPGLKTLWLTNNAIDEEGARALGESEHLKSLETLYIGRNYFKDHGAKILYEHTALPNLKNLVLREEMSEEAGFVNYSRPELLRPEAEAG